MEPFKQLKLSRLMTLGFAGLLSFFVLACDAGFNEDPKDDETLKDANKIFNEYSRIQGVYQGLMELKVDGNISTVEIEVRLKPEVKYSDNRKDGELVPEVNLTGSVEVLNFEWYYNYTSYQGRYWYAQDGRIQMAEVETMGKQPQGLWFQAYPSEKRLVRGELWDGSGLMGTFEATLINKDVRAPGEGGREEERKRLKDAYKDLLGIYTGMVTNPNDPMEKRRRFPYRFHFYLEASQLYVSLDRPDLEHDIPRVIKIIEFRPDTGYLEISADAQVGRNPGWGKFFARGKLKGKKLTFTEMSDHIGPLGIFRGQKLE